MKQINYMDAMRITTEKLAGNGVFLNVGGDVPNTMTIGWAAIGNIWNKPVFMALVRKQRHTWKLIRDAGEFSVSVPTKNALRDELRFAGTASGRDCDKFSGHGLTADSAQIVSAPIIKECGIHFECKTLLTQDMTPDEMDPSLVNGTYRAGDFHTMFFGEIVACYTTDE